MGRDPRAGALRRQDLRERQAAVRRDQRAVRPEGLLLGQERLLRGALRMGLADRDAAHQQPAGCGVSDGGDDPHQYGQ
nr:MAG TPA: hypothetical protein [Caudoviricetes sp.]